MKEARFRRLMFCMGLLAAMASTPLRLVEAASDQARTLAELDSDRSIEAIDGGVGDDSDASIRADTAEESVWLAIAIPLDGPSSLSASIAMVSGRAPDFQAERPPRRPPNLTERLAKLQRFRI